MNCKSYNFSQIHKIYKRTEVINHITAPPHTHNSDKQVNKENHSLPGQKPTNNNLHGTKGWAHHVFVSRKFYNTCEKAKVLLEETKKTSKPDSEMIEMLELSEQEIKAIRIKYKNKWAM